jgi:hypothetical protein
MAYWAVDIFELNREQAEALVAYAKREFGLQGSSLDPKYWYSRHMDAHTVESLLETIPPESRVDWGVVGDLTEWLGTAERYPSD